MYIVQSGERRKEKKKNGLVWPSRRAVAIFINRELTYTVRASARPMKMLILNDGQKATERNETRNTTGRKNEIKRERERVNIPRWERFLSRSRRKLLRQRVPPLIVYLVDVFNIQQVVERDAFINLDRFSSIFIVYIYFFFIFSPY